MGGGYSISNYRDTIKWMDRDLWKHLKAWKPSKDGQEQPPKNKLELYKYLCKELTIRQKENYIIFLYKRLLSPYVGVDGYDDEIKQIMTSFGTSLADKIKYKDLWVDEADRRRETTTLRAHFVKTMNNTETLPRGYPFMSERGGICEKCGHNKVSYAASMDDGTYWDKYFEGWTVRHKRHTFWCNKCGYSKCAVEDVDL